MIQPDHDSVSQRVPLLDYLQKHGWKPIRSYGGGEIAGLCPFHRETRPSFFVNRYKQVFYCHGCGQGGGLCRLKRLLETSTAAPARKDPAELLAATYSFYEQQLLHHAESRAYLAARGIHDPSVIEALRIGYAPGACLRAHLARSGFSLQAMQDCGLVNRQGRDHFFRCLTFPVERSENLYGRSIENAAWRHRFLPRPKGGLYGWERHTYIRASSWLRVFSIWPHYGKPVLAMRCRQWALT